MYIVMAPTTCKERQAWASVGESSEREREAKVSLAEVSRPLFNDTGQGIR